MENTTPQPTRDIRVVRKMKADEAFAKLMEIAESDHHEFELKKTQDEQAEYMLAKVLQHGTYSDAACAIKYYFKFMMATCMNGLI